jgi:hydrogenase maturation protease
LRSVRVIGVGSPFGCDAIGWQAVDALQQLGLADAFTAADVTLVKLDRPGAGLLQQMQGFDLVIIIDALVCDGAPDRVLVLEQDEISTQTGLLSAHGLGVAEALALGRALGDLPPALQLLGITIDPVAASSEIKPGIVTELWDHIFQQVVSA